MNKHILAAAFKANYGFEIDQCNLDSLALEYARRTTGAAPVAEYANVGTPKTSAELSALAIEAEAAEQVAAEAKARADQLTYQVGLAGATAALLQGIQQLDAGYTELASQGQFAKYRKDLAPLAADYGYKIVLVGDKSKATLSK